MSYVLLGIFLPTFLPPALDKPNLCGILCSILGTAGALSQNLKFLKEGKEMRKKLSIVLIVLAVVGIGVGVALATISTEQVGKFNRFTWSQSITLPAETVVYLDPIDTKDYDTLVVHVSGLNGDVDKYSVINEDALCYAQVETRLYSDDSFVPQQNNSGKDLFLITKPRDSRSIFYNDTRWPEIINGGSSSFMVEIQGTETRLKLFTGYSQTVKVTGALLKRGKQTTSPFGE